jgi:hypothetical protein
MGAQRARRAVAEAGSACALQTPAPVAASIARVQALFSSGVGRGGGAAAAAASNVGGGASHAAVAAAQKLRRLGLQQMAMGLQALEEADAVEAQAAAARPVAGGAFAAPKEAAAARQAP